MSNEIAPPGAVWVCQCGKRSRDRYGMQKISKGWDESCMLNSDLYDEKSLTFDGDLVQSGTLWTGEDPPQNEPLTPHDQNI